VLRSTARAFLTVCLVGVMVGSAVAFAVGGGFSPHKTICVHPIPNSSYQICVQTKPVDVKHVTLTGFNLGKIKTGHLNFTFRNANKVQVKLVLALVVKTTANKIHRYSRTFVLAPGARFNFQRSLTNINVRAAKLTLTITDTVGDRAVITRTVGKFG
jgi:hypothetical protein